MTISLSAASLESSWKELFPLPDPIGFAGMFAGVSEGCLFAGGGSRFVEKPIWKGGVKGYSDRVFVLKDSQGAWEELPERLPGEMAHGACAVWGEEAIFAGGVNSSGPLRDVYRFRIERGTLKVTALPPLPHPVVYGAAAVVRDVLYVLGGVPDAASTTPLQECWALPLGCQNAEWSREPDFPGKAGIVMAAASDEASLYVFGGTHFTKSEEGKAQPQPLDKAYCYDPVSRTWRQIADLPVARVGASTPCPLLPDGRLLVAGGSGVAFSGPANEHPGFESETLVYSLADNRWEQGPALPCKRQPNPDISWSRGPEPMVGAPAVLWNGMAVIISGEVRPATRTPAVICIPVSEIR